MKTKTPTPPPGAHMPKRAENPFAPKFLHADRRRELIDSKVIHKAWQICRGRISKATFSRTLAGRIRRPRALVVKYLFRAIEATRAGGPK